MAFEACSGAETADLFAPTHQGDFTPNGQLEPAQLCGAKGATSCPPGTTPWLGTATKVVTLTIGGIDSGFTEVLQDCVQLSFFELVDQNCLRNPILASQVAGRIDALAGKNTSPRTTTSTGQAIHPLSSVLATIHQIAPNAHVYMAGYPLLFGNFTGNCPVGKVTYHISRLHSITVDAMIRSSDAQALNSLAVRLNSVISAAAREAGSWATFVDPTSTFLGHGFCDTSTLWFHQLSTGLTLTLQPVDLDPGSFHPTPDGQRLGYEAAFIKAGA